MKLPIVYTNKNHGFTLVEILVVIGLVGMVLAVGSLINIKMFTRELSYSEVDVLVGVLQNARSRAMNNIDASPHGVHYVNGDDSYSLFVGGSYDTKDSEILVDRPKSENTTNDNIVITMDGEDEWEVVFDQLSGSVDSDNTGTITITNLSNGDKEIIISENGMIDW